MVEREIRKVEKPETLQDFEELQGEVWPGSQVDIVPTHILLAAINT